MVSFAIAAIGPPRKIGISFAIFGFFRPTQKIAWDGPKWGRDVLFLANPDLADILGDMVFDFVIFYFLFCLAPNFPDVQVPNFQVPRFPNFQIPRRRRRRTNSQIPT